MAAELPEREIPTPRGAWCPEFRPSRDEFANFVRYVRTVVEPRCAGVGMCKIIPPRGWFARDYDVDKLECKVARPVGQHVAGKKGIFNVDLVERKTMSASEFRALAEAISGDEPSDDEDPEDIERKFWKSLRPTMDAPVYGADIVGSLFGDADAMSWNLSDLKSILRHIDLPGVTRPMLYFGMWRAMFSFHTEDMDLYSINYVHTGKPKFWYAIPPDAAPQLERAAQAMFPEKHHECAQFMRHKTSLISPARLRDFGVPYSKAFQKPGEFIITFPATYHQGFNVGFNIAEAVNFATMHWIPYGLKAKVCKCRPDSVRIDMDTFLPKIFSGPPIVPDAIEDGAWIFSCQCGKYCSSKDADVAVEEPWFECSKCKIWAHVRCIHPDLAETNEEDLPQSLLCHRCDPESESVGLGKRKNASPRKRRTSKARLDTQSPQLDKKTLARAPSTSSPKRRRDLFRKELFQKGAIVQFEDAEARVAAIEGNHVRLHYKGQSTEDDEWLAVSSPKLQQRIVSIAPPRPHGKAKASASASATT